MLRIAIKMAMTMLMLTAMLKYGKSQALSMQRVLEYYRFTTI